MFLLALIALLIPFPPVAEASARARVTARIPAVATVGDVVRITGRGPGGSVAMEQRVRGSWVARARRRAGRRFSLPWRAPRGEGVVWLRVAVLRGGRRVAVSRPRRVAVSATEVLRPGRVAGAPPPGSAGTLRYEGRAVVRPGEFVAADIGPATPEGLLARVVSARVDAGETVLEVVPASLVEAVPEGRIDLAPVAAVAAAPALRGFRSALSCGPGVGGEITGSVSIRVIPRFKLSWSLGGVEGADARVTIRGRADLSVRLGAAGRCALEDLEVASWDAPALRFSVGPIPVVIVPKVALRVSGEASGGGAMEVGIDGRLSATAGLRYDGDVHPVGAFEHGFTHTAPEARVSASLGARVAPSVTFLLYGRAGPRFDLSAGLQLDAAPDASPWWTLTAPVELSAGLEVPGIDELSIPQQPVFSRSFPLAEADGDRAAPRGGERARIAWDTAATDVDLHVWDQAGHHAWFRDPEAVPGGQLSEDDRFGFGPEYFFYGGAGGTLTYGLCYFDDSGAGATSVSVRLTDPGGGVRQLTRTLAHEGDTVLLGSSPAGSGFSPPAGWCNT